MKKIYFDTQTRAEYLIKLFPKFLKSTILDVGSGGSPLILKSQFKNMYTSLDVTETRCKPDIFVNFEKEKLPLNDRSYDTVLCMDCLEHVENIHSLFDELCRVSNKYVIISLPNNWASFIKSFFRGHNVTHKAGYGLKPKAEIPGFRHKWFFNIEEAQNFLKIRSTINNCNILDTKYIYEYSHDCLFNFLNYSKILKFQNFHIKKIINNEFNPSSIIEHYSCNLIKFLGYNKSKLALKVIKNIFARPLFYLDDFFKRLIWGWGNKFRYLNLFCRQIWVVIEKK